MKYNRATIIALLVAVLGTHSLVAQSWRENVPDDVPLAELRVFDAAGKRTELYFGVHPEGSYGYDYHLGETPVPPVPVTGVFEARFGDLPRQSRTPPGGCYVDIRRYINGADIDTFLVRAQPLNGAYPITIAWEQKKLAVLFGEATLEYKDANGIQRKDMLQTHSISLTEEEMSMILIIVHAKPGQAFRRITSAP